MPLAVLFMIQFHKFQITEKKIIQKGQSTVVTGSQLSVNCLQRAKKRLVDFNENNRYNGNDLPQRYRQL